MNNIYDADDSSIINPTTGEAQARLSLVTPTLISLIS